MDTSIVYIVIIIIILMCYFQSKCNSEFFTGNRSFKSAYNNVSLCRDHDCVNNESEKCTKVCDNLNTQGCKTICDSLKNDMHNSIRYQHLIFGRPIAELEL
jgi:hypothetical protein